MLSSNKISKQVFLLVLVAGLGYFVDIYDLILFGIVRNPSLQGIGIPKEQWHDQGVFLLQMQMWGMLIGGIIWGVLGDRKGRLSTLFFTILIYSLANIANGFVQNMTQYAILRFIAGLGLAGELGVGITLVSEVMTKESRGYGTAIVSGIGIAGATLGYLICDQFGWKEAYWTGGGLGLALLVLRILVNESSMFEKMKHTVVKRGNFFKLFTSKERFTKYIQCIFIGVPVWYVIGILIIFCPEFATNVFHVKGEIVAGRALMFHYTGASLGSFLVGFMSQWFRSRKKALTISLLALTVFVALFFVCFGVSASMFYFVIFLLGLGQGYWSVFITVASEQFGTNIRATVATTVPNFVRGSSILLTFVYEKIGTAANGKWEGGAVVGVMVLIMAFVSLYTMRETYGKELDYIEPM